MRTTRHNGLNAAWCQAARDGLSTPVTQCVKGARDNDDVRAAARAAYADLNDGHIPDWGARGAARSGRHLVGETKCYDPLVPHSSGAGSRGGIAMMGATRPLGNTEEALIKTNYGLAERGVGSTTAFDHATGAGHVSEHKGAYHDCIHVKGNTLLLLISEIFGGVNGRAIRWLTRLAHQSRESSDAAYYDRAGRVVSFFHHHACAVSRAAAVGHGRVLLKVAADTRNRAACMQANVLNRSVAAARANGAGAVLMPLPRVVAPLA